MKMIRANFSYDVNVLQDALEEAKNLLSLRHQHIVKYLDVFVHRDNRALRRQRCGAGGSDIESDSSDGGDGAGNAMVSSRGDGFDGDEERDQRSKGFDFVCIVMEYCAGGTLLEFVATGVPLPLDVILCSFSQIGTALRYVHRQGVVHHDVRTYGDES